MGRSERWGNMAFHRLDRISNMNLEDKPATPITSVEGYENGIDYKRLATAMPYMYADAPERIELIADECIVDQIVDWFGKEITLIPMPDDDKKVKVSLIASPHAMELWALQYLKYVEITKPESLREQIKTSLRAGIEKYS